jgi:hypothetical protein
MARRRHQLSLAYKEIVFCSIALEEQNSEIFLVFKTKYKTDFKKGMSQLNSGFEVSSEKVNLL